MTLRDKGYARTSDIPPAVLRRLSRGEEESLTLVEAMASDLAVLMERNVAGISGAAVRDMRRAAASGTGWLTRTKLAGSLIYRDCGLDIVPDLSRHRSDQLRGWAACVMAAAPMKLSARLRTIRPLANDPHAGVREIAWIATRPFVAAELDAAMKQLAPWRFDKSANLRRFAVEITRPRGVWCKHIAALRQDPSRGADYLAPLMTDPSRYVQNAVANWLNDAAKDHPDWVMKTTATWAQESRDPATAYIIRRARRNIE